MIHLFNGLTKKKDFQMGTHTPEGVGNDQKISQIYMLEGTNVYGFFPPMSISYNLLLRCCCSSSLAKYIHTPNLFTYAFGTMWHRPGQEWESEPIALLSALQKEPEKRRYLIDPFVDPEVPERKDHRRNCF